MSHSREQYFPKVSVMRTSDHALYNLILCSVSIKFILHVFNPHTGTCDSSITLNPGEKLGNNVNENITL
jgi:hypothetical protein